MSERFFFLLCARRECGGGVALGAQRVALLEDGPVRGDGAQRLGEGRVLCELLLGARGHRESAYLVPLQKEESLRERANPVMCKRPASGPSPAKKAKKAKTAYELWKKEQPEHAESGGDDDDTPDLGTMPDEELSHVIKLLGGDPKVRAAP